MGKRVGRLKMEPEKKMIAGAIKEELSQIESALEIAREYKLEAEVVWSMLQYHERDKLDSLSVTLSKALDDWDI